MSPAMWREQALPGGPGAARAVFDRLAAACGLILLAPVGLLLAIAIVLEDGLPVLFLQPRVGRAGRAFRLFKFRSMRRNNSGAAITASGDPRVTRVGAFIRRYKLDELPQLWNVVRGDMSLIGPRPEVPRYVDMESVLWRNVLAVRPGITDLATLVYRNEEEVLARAGDPEQCYREQVLPDKLRLNLEYLERRSWRLDLRLLMLTIRFSVAPRGFDGLDIKRELFRPKGEA